MLYAIKIKVEILFFLHFYSICVINYSKNITSCMF